MIVDISDEWLKRMLNVSPDGSISDGLHLQLQKGINQKLFIFALGEYVLHELGKQNEKS